MTHREFSSKEDAACTPNLRGVSSAQFAVHTFAQIAQAHSALLIIDAASASLQIGWVEQNQKSQWVTLETEAGTGIYAALEQLGVNPNRASAFIFCEGPGSMLGIRTVAAALRTWVALRPRPIFSYRSLDLAALALGNPQLTFICDARRQSWHTLTLNQDGQPGEILRVATADLPASPIHTLRGFRSWTPLPDPPPNEVDYDAASLTKALSEIPLLRENSDPDAFQPERPTYARWRPEVHQAPKS